MQYNVDTPKEYLAMLEEDWRKDKLLEIRQFILNSMPEIEEGIRYKMLSYGSQSNYIFALNAQKHYVSLYVGNIKKIEGAEELLKEFDYGKGCIRIKKSTNIEHSKLKEFINKTIEVWKNGENIDC